MAGVKFVPSQRTFGCDCPSDGGCTSLNNVDSFGCPLDRCPDFVIKRHDTRPVFKVNINDCDGPLDLTGLVLEVNMWAIAKLKTDITTTDTYFRLSNDIGFNQVMVGDIIIMDRIRLPEHMLVIGFDENNKLIKVQRGYNGTQVANWKKGSFMRIFRVLNSPGETEMIFEDQLQPDGTVLKDQLVESFLIYEWQPEDTCLPGCFWLEFKLMKMKGPSFFLPGGTWDGAKHLVNGMYMTGTIQTDSSVQLFFDPGTNSYLLPESDQWAGAIHLYSDQYYTGSVHNDGSVPLSLTNILPMMALACDTCGISTASIIPSFTDPALTPSNFGCILGDGVEWARRFPDSEGFLIKIACSPTTEF